MCWQSTNSDCSDYNMSAILYIRLTSDHALYNMASNTCHKTPQYHSESLTSLHKAHPFLQFIQLFLVLGQNVLANKLRSFELLPTQRTQPLVLRQLLRVGRYKLLNFCIGRKTVKDSRLHNSSYRPSCPTKQLHQTVQYL